MRASAAPVMTIWSKPVSFSSGPKCPPAAESPRIPVRGERAVTV